MLFSRKENVFRCLAASEFVLRKINSGVWFVQTFYEKWLPFTAPTFPNIILQHHCKILHRTGVPSQQNHNTKFYTLIPLNIHEHSLNKKWIIKKNIYIYIYKMHIGSDVHVDRTCVFYGGGGSVTVGRNRRLLRSGGSAFASWRNRRSVRRWSAFGTLAPLVDRTARRRGEARSSLSLSDLVLVFSLSLSLSLFFRK